MDNILNTFIDFIEDPNAFDMFITGSAGTGKTTKLADIISYCIDNDISVVTTAYTHKACNVLRSKLPEGSKVCTLHSFLRKRPGVNDDALIKDHISISNKHGMPDNIPMLLCIDEYSTVGERDYMDIGLVQDPDYEGKPVMKVLYIGDPNQLPPVKDTTAIKPTGKYQIFLDKIWRQSEDNGLLEPLSQLVEYINGIPPKPLVENQHFIRNVDIIKEYEKCETDDKIILAYTNEVVENLNAKIKGRPDPDYEDLIFSPTLKEFYTYVEPINEIKSISLPFGEELGLKSKYKTLEHLQKIHSHYAILVDPEGDDFTFAVEFGHYQYKLKLEQLGELAVQANKEIEKESGMGGKTFANMYPHHPLSRKRAKAWRDYLTYKDCVVCIDFPFAITVHKSQGSTFNTVFIDTKNIGLCADKDYNTYLKLLYVAISRASNKVYTN